MIKAKVVTFKLSRTNGSLLKLELETYLEDQVDINSFCMGIDSDGTMDAVIMNEEEYKALDSVSDVLRKSLLNENEKLREGVEGLKVKNANIRFDRGIINLDNSRLRKIVKEQSETIQKLEEENQSIKDDIRDLEEKMAQDADEVDIHPGGTIIFRKKIVSELEKKVEKLEKSKSDMWLERNTLKAENERLQKKIEDFDKSNKRLNGQYIQQTSDKFSLNITGGLFYKKD